MAPLVLIDAYSQIFRCFFAVRDLTNSRGEPTNALLPFARMLIKFQQRFPDNPGAIVFDCGRVEFRTKLNPDYKATRPPMPEALRKQIPHLRDLADAFGWPLLEEKEYEADDLIAAMAKANPGPVRIVSSDKDLAQLIDDRIEMLVPDAKGPWEERNQARVLEKFAVRPDQIIDYLALLGDSSDNIAGVPGIGPKGAAELLREHDSLDHIFCDPAKVASERKRALLVEHRELLERNRALIRLRTDLPAAYADLETVCRRRPPDWERIRAICETMELRSVLRELPAEAGDTPTDPDDLFAAPAAPVPAPATAPAAPPSKAEPQAEQPDLFGDF